MIENLLIIWNKILTSNLFNFVLMLVFLGWIIDKFNLADILEKNRQKIEDRINLAKSEKESAINTLFETQEYSKEVEREAGEIISKSEHNAVLVGEKLLDDAIKQKELFSSSVEKTISSNIETTRLNLINDIADKVIEKSRTYIENRLKEDRSLHMKYITESIDALREVGL